MFPVMKNLNGTKRPQPAVTPQVPTRPPTQRPLTHVARRRSRSAASRIAGAKSPDRAPRDPGCGVNFRSAASHYRKLLRFPRNGWRGFLLA